MKILKPAMLSTTLLGLLLTSVSCGSSRNQECIDPSQISEGPCTMEYNPVCGCDGKTYSNPCQAQRGGVRSWESGSCNGD